MSHQAEDTEAKVGYHALRLLPPLFCPAPWEKNEWPYLPGPWATDRKVTLYASRIVRGWASLT